MKITVLIPNHNNEPYLKECLTSIINQSFKDFEILIIDDGSTDNSVALIKSFNEPKIKLIEKEKNSGIIDTLNIGLNHIKTEYIIRMDGDDLMHKNRIEKLYHFMETHPEIGVCGSAIKHFGISEETIQYEMSSKQVLADMLFHHSIGHASVIFRTEVLKNNNIRYSHGFNYIEDYKIFYDLSKATKLTSIPDTLYYYRREEYNNYKNKELKNKGKLKIYKEIFDSLNYNSNINILQLHLEIASSGKLNYRKGVYKKHLNKIIELNQEHQIFPEKELKKVISKMTNKLFYRLVSSNKINFFEALEFIINSKRMAIYFFKMKLKP